MIEATEQSSLRVLVVDDNPDLVNSTALLLELMGHEAETASNGLDAIARADAFQPHVALLDLCMPRMDGYEAARQIQQLGLANPPVLIAVSALSDPEARVRSAEAGFDLHLTKPVDPGVFETFHVLVEGLGHKLDRLKQLRRQHAKILADLMREHLQTGHSLLRIANTTEYESNRARAIAKARRICDRLLSWMARNPNLHPIRDDVEHLARLLPQEEAGLPQASTNWR